MSVVGLAVLVLSAASAAAADYISAAKCKMCHKVQYASWEGLAHATAFDTLEGDDHSNTSVVELGRGVTGLFCGVVESAGERDTVNTRPHAYQI